MTVFHEGRHPGAYIVGEVEYLSRETVTFASGAVVEPGTVVARVTASEKYVPLDPSKNDGSQTADGISFGHVDASAADVVGVITERLTAVSAAELLWPAGITEAQKTAALTALRAKHIKAR
ncbi:head decoration protein [Rhodomicrobium sp.]|uniref:head decoration protein n=1 Tax=Rhodomicrobium sp. TaxID=2720632 RepID=UPI0039E5B769